MTSFGLAGASTALTRRAAEPMLAGDSGDVGGDETAGENGGSTTETDGRSGVLPPAPLPFRMNTASASGSDSDELGAVALERLPTADADHVVTVDAPDDAVLARTSGRTTAVVGVVVIHVDDAFEKASD